MENFPPPPPPPAPLPPPPLPAYQRYKQLVTSSFNDEDFPIDKYYPIAAAVLMFIFLSNGGNGGILSLLVSIPAALLTYYLTRKAMIAKRADYHYYKAWANGAGWEYHPQITPIIPANNPVAAGNQGFVFKNGFTFATNVTGGIANYAAGGPKLDQQNTMPAAYQRMIDQLSDQLPDTNNRTPKYTIGWIRYDAPVRSMKLSKRSMEASLVDNLIDNLQTRLMHKQNMKFESEMFDQHFKLELDNLDNELIIRRMFSPEILDNLVSGKLQLDWPINYYQGHLWFIQKGNFSAPNLANDINRVWIPLTQNLIVMNQIMQKLD